MKAGGKNMDVKAALKIASKIISVASAIVALGLEITNNMKKTKWCNS